MDRKNSGAERSKKCLADALFSLMKQKPFSEISITDIAREADYTRQTFYQHFTTKEDVLQYYLDDLFDREYRNTQPGTEGMDGEDLLRVVCQKAMQLFWGAHSDLAEVIMDNHLSTLLVEALVRYWSIVFHDSSVPIPMDRFSEEEKQLIYRYISGGPFHMFYYWIGTGRQYDEEKLLELLVDMLRPLFVE